MPFSANSDSRPLWMNDWERATDLVLKPGGPTPEELDEARELARKVEADSGDDGTMMRFEEMVSEWLDSDQLSHFAAGMPEDRTAFDYKDEDMPPPGSMDPEIEKTTQMDRLVKAKRRGETA